MHSFRMRLVLALIAGVTIVSVASTYFEVLAHKHLLRQELEQRSIWMGASIQPEIERTVIEGNTAALPALVDQFSPVPTLTPHWVESLFLVASIFEHAPPAHC